MKHLGHGRYQDAEGNVFTHDAGEDLPPLCAACQQERADGPDGLCSFCREDARPQRSAAELAAAKAEGARQYAWHVENARKLGRLPWQRPLDVGAPEPAVNAGDERRSA